MSISPGWMKWEIGGGTTQSFDPGPYSVALEGNGKRRRFAMGSPHPRDAFVAEKLKCCLQSQLQERGAKHRDSW